MNKKSNLFHSINFIIVFVIVVIVLSIASFTKLINFYVNDEIDYNEWSVELGNKFETDISSNFYEKFQFINLNGAMRNLLGQHEMNGVVKLNNGYLVQPISRCSDQNIAYYASQTEKLKNYLEQKNIPLMYATATYSVNKYDPQLPAGVSDYGNDNIDRLLEKLQEKGIETIDIREEMYQDGINQYDMMYKTDHHWTTQAGFYVYNKIQSYLLPKLNCEIDTRVADISNYEVTTYEKWHLGSCGQRTGIYYSGIDDFDLILPKFETSLQIGDQSGSVTDLIYNMEPLNSRDHTSRYTYDHVLLGSLNDYWNYNSHNDKTILIITDSMGRCVNPYFIMSYQKTCTVQNAYSNYLSPEYIEAVQPDAVIMLYHPWHIVDGSTAFEFSGF